MQTNNTIITANPATMSVMDAIYQRRAVRSYTAKPVETDAINALLEAAVHAPTAVHEEPWAFVVIQNPKTLKRLSDTAKRLIPFLERDIHLPGEKTHHFTPPENIFYSAETLIVVYGKPVGAFVVADCWLAAENLMLAACGMGLGTCVIGLAVAALNTPEWKSEFNVPQSMTAYAPIIVGVPAGPTPATGRQKPEVLSWKPEVKN
jgi:nitroreductase